MVPNIKEVPDHQPPWELAIPFALAIALIILNALSLSLMIKNAITTLSGQVPRGVRLPPALIPAQLAPFLTWVSDGSQAILVVIAPFFGLATVKQNSEVAWLLAAAATVAGVALFRFVYSYKSPMEYTTYAQRVFRWLAAPEAKKRKVLRPLISRVLRIAQKLRITLVTLISLTINFMFMVFALIIGYVTA
jgi:hypothetical protein